MKNTDSKHTDIKAALSHSQGGFFIERGMVMLNEIFESFWKTVKKSDDKRLSVQKIPSGVTESNNHYYIDDGSEWHALDVYYPDNAAGKLPVIIDIHGGGWMYGSKELNKNYCLALAQRGYVVFNMSYRLVPDVIMADQLHDVSMAFRWIYKNMDEFPCDTDNIFLTGDSAGGQLAAFSAVISDCAELRRAFCFAESRLRFNAIGLTSPVAFLEPKGAMGVYFRKVVGETYKFKKYAKCLDLDKILEIGSIPPTYLVTSSGDSIGRKPTLKAYDCIRSKGVDVELSDWGKTNGKELPHVFAVLEPLSEEGAEEISNMLEFFAKHTK